MQSTVRTFSLALLAFFITQLFFTVNAQSPDSVVIRNTGGTGRVIVTVEKSRVRVGELVRFTISPASVVTDPRNSVIVDFGDGTRIRTRQPYISHRYRATGHYDVYASVQSGAVQLPIPRVNLTASQTSLNVGGTVSFAAQLSSAYPGVKYRFVYGDGAQSGWQEQPSARHVYRSPGTHLAYVDLGLDQGGGIRQVAGSLRQAIVVSTSFISNNNTNTNQSTNNTDPDNPRLPRNVELAVNPSPVQISKQVTFSARTRSNNSNLRYRFVFGDGSSSNWQTSAQATHAYGKAGTYAASVSLGVAARRGVRQLAQDGQAIEVTSVPPVAVEFSATPVPAQLGQAITFNAQANSNDPNLRYRFVFGDRNSNPNWQSAAQASYSYPRAGQYTAHVEIGRFSAGRVEPLGRSATKTISVADGGVASASPGPTQFGGPTGSPTGSPGTVIGRPSDGSDGPGSGLPDNWWVYWIIASLLLFVGYEGYKSLLAPRATLHPSMDAGSSELEAGAKGLEINTQVLMRPDIADARYAVETDEGGLVRSVRRENV